MAKKKTNKSKGYWAKKDREPTASEISAAEKRSGVKTFSSVVEKLEAQALAGEKPKYKWRSSKKSKGKKKSKKSDKSYGGVEKKSKTKTKKVKPSRPVGEKCAYSQKEFNKRNIQRTPSARKQPGPEFRDHCFGKDKGYHQRRYPGGGAGKYVARNPRKR